MRKFAIGITGAVTLMLVGSAGQNTEAMTLAVHSQPNYSLVERAGCWLPDCLGDVI